LSGFRVNQELTAPSSHFPDAVFCFRLGAAVKPSSWLLLFVISIPSTVYAQGDRQQTVPFTLDWTKGKCVRCETAVGLGRIQFVNRDHAWAVGFRYGEQGAGDFIIVHTKDGGHTWREVRQSRQHAGDEDGPPAFSFLDAARGWVAWWNPAVEPKIIRTEDGGDHWRTVSGESLQKLLFFDENKAYGTEVTKFLSTNDGGRHWIESQIPDIRFIDRMFFLSPEIGWLTGSNGKEFLVFRTANGGRDWQESRTKPPDEIAMVRDVFFLNDKRGWLVTWQMNDGGTYLYSTEDGGQTWLRNPDLSFQGKNKWIAVVRFVSEEKGLLFEREGDANKLLFTQDGGAHWATQAIPHSVFDCQVHESDLLCDGGNQDFWLLRLHPK